MRKISRAQWHWHLHALTTAGALRDWLKLSSSLTDRLRASAKDFRVLRLHQRPNRCLSDESSALGLQRRLRVREREVLLCCNGKPVVFAHTVVPLSATRSDWPAFNSLGERSLGTSLFHDPQVRRGRLQFAHLPAAHPLIQRICAAIPAERLESRFHARRCLFYRGRGRMLVTEVFLPGIINFYRTRHNQ